VDDPYCLTGIIGFMQLVLVSTAQIAATLTPTQSAAWLRDHDPGIDDHLGRNG
jgi:hypothetical protein